jgi:hypothetical protein
VNVRQAVNTLRQVFTNADRVAATIPKPIRTEHDTLAALAEKVRHGLDIGDDLPAAVLDALAAGRDPVTDARVRDAVVAREVAGCGHSVETALNARVVDFLHRNADAILAAFVTPFDAAAATIAAVADKLGPVDLDDTRAILNRGGDAAQLWADAQNAERVIKTIRDTFALFGAIHPSHAVDARYKILTYADVPAGRFLDDQLSRVDLPAFEVVQRGIPLSLASRDVLRSRIDAVQREVAARQARHDSAFRDAHRRTRGTGVPAA